MTTEPKDEKGRREARTLAVDFDNMEEVDEVASNFDGKVRSGAESDLKAGKWGRYAGCNFNGKVAWNPTTNKFICEVWQYHVPVKIVETDTLEEMMKEISEEFGYD